MGGLKLRLEGNSLQLSPRAFNGLRKLKVLDLAEYDFASLPADAFRGLGSLELNLINKSLLLPRELDHARGHRTLALKSAEEVECARLLVSKQRIVLADNECRADTSGASLEGTSSLH